MEEKVLENICKQVYRQFPEVKSVKPTKRSQPGNQTLLIFKASAKTADGNTLPRSVRVVVNADGKIVKTSTSR